MILGGLLLRLERLGSPFPPEELYLPQRRVVLNVFSCRWPAFLLSKSGSSALSVSSIFIVRTARKCFRLLELFRVLSHFFLTRECSRDPPLLSYDYGHA